MVQMGGYYGLGGMGGGGFVSIIVYVIIGVVLVGVLGAAVGRRRFGVPMVLKEFTLKENEEEFLTIKGRAAGLINWIMSLLGLNRVTTLVCNSKTVIWESAAAKFGKDTRNITLTSVSCVSSGFRKPFMSLVLGVIVFLCGIIAAIAMESFGIFLIGLLTGGLFFVHYFLNKSMYFSIITGGDSPIAAICLKKSIIEGLDIDEAKFDTAAALLMKAVLRSKGSA